MSVNNRNFNYKTWAEGANLFSTLCQEEKYDDAAYLMLSDTSHVDFDFEDRLRFHSMYENKAIFPCNQHLFNILKMSAEANSCKEVSDYIAKVGNSLKPYNINDVLLFCCFDLYSLDINLLICVMKDSSNKIPHRVYFRYFDKFLNEDKSSFQKSWVRNSMAVFIMKAMKLGIKIEDYADEYIEKIYSVLSPYSIDVYFMMVGVFGEEKLLRFARGMAKYFIDIDDMESGRKFVELCETAFNCPKTSVVVRSVFGMGGVGWKGLR